MVQVNFEVDGVTQLSRNLSLMVDNLDNLSDFYNDALDLVEQRTDKLFKSKGQNLRDGGERPPLSKKTKQMRRDREGYYERPPGPNPSVLVWTGNLKKSRTRFANETEAALTMDADYAAKLHRGEESERLPARPIIDLDNRTNEEIMRSLQKHIRKNVGIYGRQV